MQGNMGQGQMFSTNDFMRLVIKIFGLMSIIFIGIAIVVPWASFSLATYGASLNSWGTSTNFPEALLLGTQKYLSDPFYLNSLQSGVGEGIVAGICMILVFIFTIITLLISIKAFRNIGTTGINKMYLFAGIFAIVTMVLCVIGVTQANSFANIIATTTGVTLPGTFGYSWGFILAIIAMIFFFINYGIDVFMMQQGMGMQKQVPYQQPQMMYASQQPPSQQPPVQQPPLQQQTPSTQQQPPMTGFCPKCGAQLQDGVKFCSSCGAKI
jgi:hypothetical protein